MRTEVMVALATAALCACNKPAPAASASDAQAPAAGATAGGPPHRKAGLWQTSVTVDGHVSPVAMKLCVDEAMEAKSQAFHAGSPASVAQSTHCDYPPPTHNIDGSYTVSFTCPTSGGGQTVTKAVATGDWSSGYHMHIENDTTGAPVAAMNGHHVTDMDGKWLGPCPAGMAGGDMELPGGMRVSGSRAAGAAKMLRGLTGGGSAGQ